MGGKRANKANKFATTRSGVVKARNGIDLRDLPDFTVEKIHALDAFIERFAEWYTSTVPLVKVRAITLKTMPWSPEHFGISHDGYINGTFPHPEIGDTYKDTSDIDTSIVASLYKWSTKHWFNSIVRGYKYKTAQVHDIMALPSDEYTRLDQFTDEDWAKFTSATTYYFVELGHKRTLSKAESKKYPNIKPYGVYLIIGLDDECMFEDTDLKMASNVITASERDQYEIVAKTSDDIPRHIKTPKVIFNAPTALKRHDLRKDQRLWISRSLLDRFEPSNGADINDAVDDCVNVNW